jgi:hypothetical protein
LQELDATVKRRQHGRRETGGEKARGMRVEGQRHHLTTRGMRDAQAFFQQGAMAKVYAVKIADSHGGSAQGSAQLQGDAVATPNGMHSFGIPGATPFVKYPHSRLLTRFRF